MYAHTLSVSLNTALRAAISRLSVGPILDSTVEYGLKYYKYLDMILALRFIVYDTSMTEDLSNICWP